MHGWCGTDIRVDDDGFYQRLQQRVEVNPEYNYEKIEVPKFGQNRPAVFVHDFKQVKSLRSFTFSIFLYIIPSCVSFCDL